MTARFISEDQRLLFGAVQAGLDSIGYRGHLWESDYQFRDWFALGTPLREIPAACFGRLPAAYDTALIGIALTNGESGRPLVNSHRALGSPIILEVESAHVNIWSVGPTEDVTERTSRLTGKEFLNWVKQHSDQLEPTEYLRAKNVRKGETQLFQGSLFAGLIPELEERIAGVLEPRLTAAFRAGLETYESDTGKPPPEATLFKLAFWMLTGKVFSDRRHVKFRGLGSNPDPDDVLARVAEHYKEPIGRLLTEATRNAVFSRIWTQMDFRNLSVDVLSQIWSRTLVTKETRKRLGIHRTRRSIVSYIVDRIPFGDFDPDDCHVLEPCAGSASFLVASMDRMRDIFPFDNPLKRHSYFKRMLKGYERDPFGVEISRLCLALADYPNPNHWQIEPNNVFTANTFQESLRKARVVLCNPPFRRFSSEEKEDFGAKLWEPPAELLRLVLKHLHPEGVLGFVMPRTFINGQWFKDIREKLVHRFSDLEVVRLPDKGWEHADPETALLIATKPHSGSRATVTYGVVRERQWQDFDWRHEIPTCNREIVDADNARKSFVVSKLKEVWDYLGYCPTIGKVAVAHRGLRWTLGLREHFDEIVKYEPTDGYVKGVDPRSKKFFSFQVPGISYLSVRPEHKRYKAFDLPWDHPKVIMNKVAKSREIWRVAAFADNDGLVCHESLIPIWPERPELVKPLAAVLNGPIANAFLAEQSGKREFVYNTIYRIPFPIFSGGQIERIDCLVDEYVQEVGRCSYARADELLRHIDATILAAYALPPRLERWLLDHFQGSDIDGPRKVPFSFGDYFPPDFEPYFSLAEWLTGKPAKATVESFRARSRDVPGHVLEALRRSEGE